MPAEISITDHSEIDTPKYVGSESLRCEFKTRRRVMAAAGSLQNLVYSHQDSKPLRDKSKLTRGQARI